MNLARSIRALALASLYAASTAAHALTTLTFDDAVAGGPFTVIDHPAGVRFSVSPAGFASYGTGFWMTDFVNGAALELTRLTTLTIELATPASYLEFGVAHDGDSTIASLFAAFPPVATVALYAPDGTALFPFVEGSVFDSGKSQRFSYLGDGIAKIELSYGFPDDNGFTLALDNLAFESIVSQPIPEPSTYALMAAGLLVLGSIARRRPRAARR